MIVLDASVALKWFVDDEPLVEEAQRVLDDIEAPPAAYIDPDLFMNEVLAVLVRLPGADAARVQEAMGLLESLGVARVGNGHELLALAADLACSWRVSGYDAVYLALATLANGVWLTADKQAASRAGRPKLVRRLGSVE